jgi:cytochrome d ubiquinol oxidase subunit II
VSDARRLGQDDMVEYFRRRAVIMAVVAGAVALIGIFVLNAEAEYVFDGLTSRALPLVLLSAACGIGSFVLLVRAASRGARVLAAGAVASLIWAWGVAQWPYILPETLKVSDAAAPSGTLTTLVVVFVVAAVTIIPSIALLYVLDQKSLLPEESIDTATATPQT